MSDTRPRRWDHYVRDMPGACNEGLDQGAFFATPERSGVCEVAFLG